MSAFQATLQLYREAAGEALSGLPRSAWAIVMLLGAHILLEVIYTWVLEPITAVNAGNGFLLGFLVALIHAGLVGLYLHLVEIGVKHRRRVRISDITENGGVYLWEVISVFFIFWIASMILMPLGPVGLIATLVAVIVFNPMPEQIYLDGTQSTQLLGDGVKFMQNNWPEWLGAHLVAALVLVFFGLGAGSGGLSLSLAFELLHIFGPFCGFIDAARLAFDEASAGPQGIILGAILLVFVHTFMLFRGHLYNKLARSSRRAREWQARMRGDAD